MTEESRGAASAPPRSFVDRLSSAALIIGLSDQRVRAANQAAAQLIGRPAATIMCSERSASTAKPSS